MSRYLIKYASRERPKWFQKAIKNLHETISGNDFLILVTADSNDNTMAQMDHFVKPYPNVKIIFGESSSKVDAINRDMDKAGEWDILVNMSDDMHFTQNGWNKIMERRTKEVWGDSLDWFAHFSDGFVHERLPTMSIMGRTYYERDKYIYHPSYKSFSCDAESLYVSQLRLRYKYFPEVLFLHQSPANSPERGDPLYRKNSLHSAQDTANYFQRLKNYFEEPITPENAEIAYNLKMLYTKYGPK